MTREEHLLAATFRGARSTAHDRLGLVRVRVRVRVGVRVRVRVRVRVTVRVRVS